MKRFLPWCARCGRLAEPRLCTGVQPRTASASGRADCFRPHGAADLVVTVLSTPRLLMMVTCFTRFVIVFSILRSGLGLQTTPANMILVSLALFMTFYSWRRPLFKAWQNGLKPYVENKITEQEAYTR